MKIDSYLSKTDRCGGTAIEITPEVKIGGGNFQMIAGPCAVESEEQICKIAQGIKEAGAALCYAGTFKSQASIHSFQGLGMAGITMLLKAKKRTGLPAASEIINEAHLSQFEHIDLIHVGPQNMQNTELLKELGHTHKPILLTRGMSSTLEELLMSVEYIVSGGNDRIILCESGIRTFEAADRSCLDLSAVPILKSWTKLPVVVAPSYAAGASGFVKPMAMAATVSGADGLLIEVHNDPNSALCNGARALDLQAFMDLADVIRNIRPLSHQY